MVLGTLNVDYTWYTEQLPIPGVTFLAQSTNRSFGGKGANQAIAAARSGASVAMIGMVGTDTNGCDYIVRLEKEHIDTKYILKNSAQHTGTAFICVDNKGENFIVVDQGANAKLDIETVSKILTQELPRSNLLLLQLETPLNIVLKALDSAAKLRVPSILNASPVNPDFPWGAVPIHTLIINKHEFQSIFSREVDDLFKLEELKRKQFLQQKQISHLVITQGSSPTLFLSPKSSFSISPPSITPVDTVGAGDTFAGVLASALASGANWEQAIKRANIAAALSTLSFGAQSAMPDFKQIDSAEVQISAKVQCACPEPFILEPALLSQSTPSH